MRRDILWFTWLLFAGVLAMSLPHDSPAAWIPDGNPVCTDTLSQEEPTIASDGAGGAIITWYDGRSSTDNDIYAQRVDGMGNVLWTAGGVAICTASEDQWFPVIVEDGSGGAIIAWSDFRSTTFLDIYVQRIDASGAPLWTANGVPVCTAAHHQQSQTIVSDGAGGAIVVWEDRRSGTQDDIYAQHVNSSGVPQWTANGVALCTDAADQGTLVGVPDGVGGAIVAWTDYRIGSGYEIYAQRINASGVPQWTTDGEVICAGGTSFMPAISADGSGGAVVGWQDFRSSVYGIYAQRIDASGLPQWTANGVALCSPPPPEAASGPSVAADGTGGAIVAWQHAVIGPTNIYAQRVDGTGATQWAANGVALCTEPAGQVSPVCVSDSLGGAIVAWLDFRSGSSNIDIYAQRVDASGAVLWPANGLPISTAEQHQQSIGMIGDGSGGAFVAWWDLRDDFPFGDIYATYVPSNGGFDPEPVPILGITVVLAGAAIGSLGMGVLRRRKPH
jgi:hypothetical protein